MRRVRVIVEGRVQGVFFRAETKRHAEELGVSGWVRNLADGRVEAVFEGEAAAVERAVEWAGRGPERASVTGMERFEQEPAEGFTGCAIR